MTVDEAIIEIRATVRDQARKLSNLKDVAEFNAYDAAFGRALAFYSQIKPRATSQVLPCGVDGRIAVSSIAGFDEGFIHLMRIEYPIINIGQPNFLDGDDWQLDLDSESRIVRFTETVPATGQEVRIVHCVPHVMPEDTDVETWSVTPSDRPAVVEWGAAECLQMLADEYAQSAESTVVQADIATFINKSGIYATRAAEMKKQFFLHLRASRSRAKGEIRIVRG